MQSKASPEVTQAFAALVDSKIADERIDLLRAALTFARIEYPEIDIELYVLRVEALARRVSALISDSDEPSECVTALNQVLFVSLRSVMTPPCAGRGRATRTPCSWVPGTHPRNRAAPPPRVRFVARNLIIRPPVA